MGDIVSIIRGIVREELKNYRTLELGTVTKLCSHESGDDKNNYACNVKLKDSGLELQNVGISTQRIGSVAIPNEDDLVLVQFINGDVNNAVITGRVYNDVDRPPVAKQHEFVYISPGLTSNSEESGIRRIYLKFPENNIFVLKNDEMRLEAGEKTITLKHDGDIEINSNSKKLTISTESDVTIKSASNINLTTDTGNLSLNANTISITGTLNTSINCPDIQVKGKIDFSP